jgi:hypothetical protein
MAAAARTLKGWWGVGETKEIKRMKERRSHARFSGLACRDLLHQITVDAS